MYDELVKRLREPCQYENCILCQQAANAIEERERLINAQLSIIKQYQEYLRKPRWIPVSERLPDSGVCVFVTDGLEVGEGWITEIINTKGQFLRWCCPTADIDVDWRPITHWMPLPEPPKEKT